MKRRPICNRLPLARNDVHGTFVPDDEVGRLMQDALMPALAVEEKMKVFICGDVGSKFVALHAGDA